MTEGQTPAGWYDDGQEQLRWFDGTAWTEHVQPLPAPTPPPAPAAAPAAPATPAAAPAQAPATAAATSSVIGTPGSHTAGDPWVEPTPIYRKPWFLIAAVVIVLALIGGAFAFAGGSDDDADNGPVASATNNPAATGTAPTGTTPTGATGTGTVTDASTIATKAGCAVSATLPPATSTAAGTEPSSKIACTLNGTLYTVASW